MKTETHRRMSCDDEDRYWSYLVTRQRKANIFGKSAEIGRSNFRKRIALQS
jgi:hypothetical protein